jgi:hypothetical protein
LLYRAFVPGDSQKVEIGGVSIARLVLFLFSSILFFPIVDLWSKYANCTGENFSLDDVVFIQTNGEERVTTVFMSILVKALLVLLTISNMRFWIKSDVDSNIAMKLQAFKFLGGKDSDMRTHGIAMSVEFMLYSFPSGILALVSYFTIARDYWFIVKCFTVLINLIHISSFLSVHFETTESSQESN